MMTRAITIAEARCAYERERLARPFGFKGAFFNELWQTATALRGSSGALGVGVSTQSVLWSDARVFSEHREDEGNTLMFKVQERALEMLTGSSFDSPIAALHAVVPGLHAYAKDITRRDDLRLTFVLNALVGIDNALWMLFCREHDLASFDQMVPPVFRQALPRRQRLLAAIPLVAYGTPLAEVVAAVKAGHCLLKIKIGSDPDGDGDPEKMVSWDAARLEEIHRAVGGADTPHTASGRTAYYLDANGRYDTRDRLLRLLDHAGRIGALGQVVLLEEPFPEESDEAVGDLGVLVAADESAHTVEDARRRIEMGYGALTLKPVAKTLSMSLEILRAAHEAGIPCFCADLTVNPVLVDWNKNVAARLAPVPGMRVGILESNGPRHYRRWKELASFHPCAGASWTVPTRGAFRLDDDFYARSGGILEIPEHYARLVNA